MENQTPPVMPVQKNYTLIVIVGIVVVLLAAFLFMSDSEPATAPEDTETPVATENGGAPAPASGSNTTVSGTVTTVQNALGKAVAPDQNAAVQVYLGSYGDSRALFTYRGNALSDVRYSDGGGVASIDKQKVTRETLVLSFSSGELTMRSFLLSGDGKKLVVTLTRGSAQSLMAEVYRVDLSTIGKTMATKLISYTAVPASSRYGIWKGIPSVTRLVEDRYAVLSVPLCSDCDAGVARGVSVVSIQTGKEIILGEAGDITFNLAADTVSYRLMGTVTVPCSSDDYTGPAPKCASGETTKRVYQPTGVTKTVKLP